MTKYVFVTGGVVSSLGKGIAASSLGYILKARGLRVTLLKCDPYLNVDPGTMSPYQHGEVYVTDDGAETDLDLGHYERFIDRNLSQLNNVTAGQIYDTIIRRERAGEYLGRTVQVIPHVTDEIKRRIYELANQDGVDVAIVEIGGTVGDIESLPFLEAIRQIRLELPRNAAMVLHLTYVPYIKAARELKTKPTQHSVKELREIGIQPDILLCRTEWSLTPSVREKIALFCNVHPESVIEAPDADTIYEVPLDLHEGELDALVLEILDLTAPEADLTEWRNMVESRSRRPRSAAPSRWWASTPIFATPTRASSRPSPTAGRPTTPPCGSAGSTPRRSRRRAPTELLDDVDGVLVPGGFGDRGIEGKVAAVRWAREKQIPFFGICLGMQCATIEFARNMCGLEGANSSEFDPETPHPVIDLMPDQRGRPGPGRHHAARRLRLPPGTGVGGPRRLRQRRRSGSATDIATSSTTTTGRSSRGAACALRASTPSGTWWRRWSCPGIRGSWPCSTIPSCAPVPIVPIHCFGISSGPPSVARKARAPDNSEISAVQS